MKRIAIMQPYFLPYIGYFQLMHSVDIFVIYDNIEFTKKGWINRNRILKNNTDEYISLPLKKASDYSLVYERFLSDNFDIEKDKLFRKVNELYRKASNFQEGIKIFKEIILHNEKNLFDFVFHSILIIKDYLDLNCEIIKSSNIDINHELKSVEKVIAISKKLNCQKYINPIGGVSLYTNETFEKEGLNLGFVQSIPITYKQFENDFVPWLSILDVIMFNKKDEIKLMLEKYQII